MHARLLVLGPTPPTQRRATSGKAKGCTGVSPPCRVIFVFGHADGATSPAPISGRPRGLLNFAAPRPWDPVYSFVSCRGARAWGHTHGGGRSGVRGMSPARPPQTRRLPVALSAQRLLAPAFPVCGGEGPRASSGGPVLTLSPLSLPPIHLVLAQHVHHNRLNHSTACCMPVHSCTLLCMAPESSAHVCRAVNASLCM